MADEVLQNLNQIRRACAAAGYRRPHYSRLHRAIEERALPPRPGGGWTTGQVLRWAEATLQRKVDLDPEAGGPELQPDQEATLAEARARAEIAVKKLQAQKLSFELERQQGRYLPREEVELMLAGRLVVLKTALLHMMRVSAADWVHLVGGRQGGTRDFLNEAEAKLESLLHKLSGMEHTVSFSQENERLVARYTFGPGQPRLPADFLSTADSTGEEATNPEGGEDDHDE